MKVESEATGTTIAINLPGAGDHAAGELSGPRASEQVAGQRGGLTFSKSKNIGKLRAMASARTSSAGLRDCQANIRRKIIFAFYSPRE